MKKFKEMKKKKINIINLKFQKNDGDIRLTARFVLKVIDHYTDNHIIVFIRVFLDFYWIESLQYILSYCIHVLNVLSSVCFVSRNYFWTKVTNWMFGVIGKKRLYSMYWQHYPRSNHKQHGEICFDFYKMNYYEVILKIE